MSALLPQPSVLLIGQERIRAYIHESSALALLLSSDIPLEFGRCKTEAADARERHADLRAGCRDRASAVEGVLDLLLPHESLRFKSDAKRGLKVNVSMLGGLLAKEEWTELEERSRMRIAECWTSVSERSRLGELLKALARSRRAPVHRPDQAGDEEFRFFVPEAYGRTDPNETIYELLGLIASGATRLSGS